MARCVTELARVNLPNPPSGAPLLADEPRDVVFLGLDKRSKSREETVRRFNFPSKSPFSLGTFESSALPSGVVRNLAFEAAVGVSNLSGTLKDFSRGELAACKVELFDSVSSST